MKKRLYLTLAVCLMAGIASAEIDKISFRLSNVSTSVVYTTNTSDELVSGEIEKIGAYVGGIGSTAIVSIVAVSNAYSPEFSIWSKTNLITSTEVYPVVQNNGTNGTAVTWYNKLMVPYNKLKLVIGGGTVTGQEAYIVIWWTRK